MQQHVACVSSDTLTPEVAKDRSNFGFATTSGLHVIWVVVVSGYLSSDVVMLCRQHLDIVFAMEGTALQDLG